VRQHFKCVELILRNWDVSHLPVHLQRSRERYLDVLHNYAGRCIFPRNYERAGIAPCFIDRNGRECAVAHLIMRSDYPDLAHNIAPIANYATIPQIASPELDAWGAQAGLSREELTLIQPGYWYTLGDILPLVLTAWVAGIITIGINLSFIARKRIGIIAPLTGMIATIALLIVALNCLDGATTAYKLGTHPDGFPYDLPLRDVGPLVGGVVISTGLALLTASLSLREIRNSYSAMRDKS
jgi:hypothetical protein